jgi:hypothetical protein
MKKLLQQAPLFLILLPVFFLTHLLTDYFRVLELRHLWIPETFWYIATAVLLFILFSNKRPLVRRLTLLVFILQFFFFFFGPIHAYLEEHTPFFGRYTVMMGMIALLVVLIGWFLVKSKQPFYGTYQYLNIVLIILLGYELLLISLLNITDGKIRRLTKDYPIAEQYKKCDTCTRPDIYFLVFDMYANASVLKSFWNHDNSRLEQFLDSTGFRQVKHSTSNYNYTVFSIGSTLNMDYHEKDLKYTNAFRSAAQLSQFEDNELFRILKKEGYDFYNYSWFHFNDAPARVAPFVLTEPRELVAAQTFWFRFRSDIAWNFKMFRKKRSTEERLTPFFVKECEDNLSRIRKSYEGIKKLSAQKDGKPVFLYAHFLMPHAPFLFDSTGTLKPKETWLSTRHEDYLDQLKYTNNMIMDLCGSLLQDTSRPKIIIVQSDHGYRNYNSKDPLTSDVEFKNLSAFYFPGKEYGRLHDSLSSVNTFRIILGEYFNYRLPLLKDTSFYMRLK